ncbi:hypothetical protein K7432_003211 [Basidiobolus ranarum]|uniref:Methylated-DNA--protein-cysteine methyltransferase n=1 Tax=Basidiobolus ranarum TaxID=34480 RepID=A0ABR2X0F7_9FUNG
MLTKVQRVSPYFIKPKMVNNDTEREDKPTQHMNGKTDQLKQTSQEIKNEVDSDIETVVPFPRTEAERSSFPNYKTNRSVTEHQFRVYDLCAQIPAGSFSTYKEISNALNSSPRAVGQALRNNPFAPLPIPCHRVLTSNYFIGGYDGDWGSGNKINSKRAKLEKEGLKFDENQVLLPQFQDSKLFTDFQL